MTGSRWPKLRPRYSNVVAADAGSQYLRLTALPSQTARPATVMAEATSNAMINVSMAPR